MSEIKLDVIVETSDAVVNIDSFASGMTEAFGTAASAADTAAMSVRSLAGAMERFPRMVVTQIAAVDVATPQIERVRQAIDSIPSEKVITLRASYEDVRLGSSGAQEPWPEASFAVGSGRVPRDMIALLHKNEAVLTVEEARTYRELAGAVSRVPSGRGGADTAPGAGGGYTLSIRNLNVTQIGGAAIKRVDRESVRRNLAPEIFRYLRRSGRGAAL